MSICSKRFKYGAATFHGVGVDISGSAVSTHRFRNRELASVRSFENLAYNRLMSGSSKKSKVRSKETRDSTNIFYFR